MKAFKFRLEKVLKYRMDRENLARQELARLEKDLRRAEERMEVLQSSYQEMVMSFQEEQGEMVTLEGLRRLSDYLVYLDREINQQGQVVFQCGQEVDRGKHRVKEAMQDRKTLEKLKDKNFHYFMEDLNSFERQVIDEVGLRNYLKPEEAVPGS